MKFSEKLARVTDLLAVNKSEVSRRAGLMPNAISGYIAKANTIPRADIAIRIAKALGVDAEWLVDPSRAWPPVFVDRETKPRKRESAAA